MAANDYIYISARRHKGHESLDYLRIRASKISRNGALPFLEVFALGFFGSWELKKKREGTRISCQVCWSTTAVATTESHTDCPRGVSSFLGTVMCWHHGLCQVHSDLKSMKVLSCLHPIWC